MNTVVHSIAYLGSAGAGFGFAIAGIAAIECVDADDMVRQLKNAVAKGTYHIIFIDEGLAKSELAVIERLNQQPLPAIILLPNPAKEERAAASALQQLMVRAIGSDIFKESPEGKKQ